MRELTLVLIFASMAALGQNPVRSQEDPAKETTDALIQRVRNNLSDAPLIGELARRSDSPNVVPALREFFMEAKLGNMVGPGGIHTSQLIAATLIKLGITDQMYFEELANYARKAIAGDPPDPFSVYHVEGNDRPETTPKFKQWCASQGYPADNCVGEWTTAYLMPLMVLQGAHDKRAIPIFREGLNASSAGMVAHAIAGLADLNDKESIPLIARACTRFSPDAAESLVAFMVAFDEPSVLSLFNLIRNPEVRERFKKEWLEKHPEVAAAKGERAK